MEYKKQMARLKALPREYQIVYDEIQKFLWRFVTGDGMDVLNALNELVNFFEEGAAHDMPVLELLGEDVGTFAENMLYEIQTRTHIDDLKKKMNERIARKL